MFSSFAARVGFVVLSGVFAVACAGSDGAPGANGESGAKGDDGKDGLNDVDGKDGVDGLSGGDGKDGVDGLNGVDGKDGVDGTNGKDAPVVVFGQFLPSQVAGGMVVSCATTNLSASTAECRGMKVNGLDVYLGPTEANAICAGITGKGYNTASGMGAVPAPWMSMSAGAWTVASAGNASPMQNLTCNK